MCMRVSFESREQTIIDIAPPETRALYNVYAIEKVIKAIVIS